MKTMVNVIVISILISIAMIAVAQEEEVMEELKTETEKTAILVEQKKQAEARKAIAEAEKQAESAAVQAEKEKSLILEEQKKQAEALQAIQTAQLQADSAAVLAAKEESALLEERKKQANAKKDIASAELSALTGGITPQSKPMTGTVTGTVTTYIPQLLVYKSLGFLSSEIADDLESHVKDKKVMLNNDSSRSANSLIALQAKMFLEEFNKALNERIDLNKTPIDPSGGLSVDGANLLSTARMSIIPGLGAATTALSAAADIAGMFKSEYTALSVTVTTDQNSLNALLSEKLTDAGALVIDMDNINFGESNAVQNFITLSNLLTQVKTSEGKIQVTIDLLKSEQGTRKKELASTKAEVAKFTDETSSEITDLQDKVNEIESMQASIDAQISNLEFAKTESAGLRDAVEKFSKQLTTVPENGRSVFMEIVLQEIRKDVDFVLDAAVVGAGGEGYIDRRWFNSTKLSVIAGVNVRYELIRKDGLVVDAGMVTRSYSANYKIRKPEKMQVVEIIYSDQRSAVSGSVPKKSGSASQNSGSTP